MTVTIGRRELLAALGVAAAWPFAARAENGSVSYLGIISAKSNRSLIAVKYFTQPKAC